MTAGNEPPPRLELTSREKALVDWLRADLQEMGLGTDHIARVLGPGAFAAWQRGSLAPVRERCRTLGEREFSNDVTAENLCTYLVLFACGDDVSQNAIDRAFSRLGAQGLIELGLARSAPHERLRATRALGPEAVSDAVSSTPLEWFIIADLGDQVRQRPVSADHVMGVGGASRTLIGLLPPAEVSRSLDLGSGCGIVALHLSLRSQQVVATDLSVRAAHTTALNARLNGRDAHIEVRCGDRFDPVAGEQFDLIASNPPFVVTPRADEHEEVVSYRDGGLEGDALMESVVRGIGEKLRPHGDAIVLANWEVRDTDADGERVHAWIADSPHLQAWLVERERLDACEYAELWARDGGLRDGSAAHTELVARWIRDFRSRGVDCIAMGALLLRANDGLEAAHPASWRVERRHEPFVTASSLGAGPLATRLMSAWNAGAWAESASSNDMLEARWQFDPSLEERRAHRPGIDDPRALSLIVASPWEREIVVDASLAATIGVCDGELSLRAIAEALSQLWNLDTGELETRLVPAFRELAWAGAVAPVDTLDR